MSNDSPVKGFRKLGGAQSSSQPPESPDSWQSQPQPPAQPNPFSAPPPAAPVSWPSVSPTATPDPWQAAAPPPPPGVSNVPNPPPPPPWQAQEPPSFYGNPPPSNANSYPQTPYGYQAQTGPNPNTAFTIELIGGLFGFFGLGYMYAGKTSEGVVRLIMGIGWNITVAIAASITVGICAFVALPVYIVVAIASANAVKNYLQNRSLNP